MRLERLLALIPTSVVFCLGFSLFLYASPPVFNETQQLVSSAATNTDGFGFSVSISGEVIVVGAEEDDDNGVDSGSATVFRFNGTSWVEEQLLLSSNGAAGDLFGVSVSVSGSVIVVGAECDDTVAGDTGSATVFRYNGSSWLEEQILIPSITVPTDSFGESVSVSGDVIVVGSTDLATVFRYSGSSWVEEQVLTQSATTSFNDFGEAVAVSGDVIVVGSISDGFGGPGSGSAQVFRFIGSSWVEEQVLLSSTGPVGGTFGEAVSVDGDLIVVGAETDDENGVESGSASVFRFDGATWVEEQVLLPCTGAPEDLFGVSVSVSGDTIVVGADGDDDNGEDSGSASVFRFNGSTWIEERLLIPSTAAADDLFGLSVSVSNNAIVVGAAGDFSSGSVGNGAFAFGPSVAAPQFQRGDCSSDASVNIADALVLLGFLFSGGAITCEDACDANDDGALTLADAVVLLSFLFNSGPLVTDCGVDATPSQLTCVSAGACP